MKKLWVGVSALLFVLSFSARAEHGYHEKIAQKAQELNRFAEHFEEGLRDVNASREVTGLTLELMRGAREIERLAKRSVPKEDLDRSFHHEVEETLRSLENSFRRDPRAFGDAHLREDLQELQKKIQELHQAINQNILPPPPPPNEVLSVKTPGNGFDGDLDLCLNYRTGQVTVTQLAGSRFAGIVNLIFDVQTTTALQRATHVGQGGTSTVLPGNWTRVRGANPVLVNWSRNGRGNPPIVQAFQTPNNACLRMIDGPDGRPGPVNVVIDWNVIR